MQPSQSRPLNSQYRERDIAAEIWMQDALHPISALTLAERSLNIMPSLRQWRRQTMRATLVLKTTSLSSAGCRSANEYCAPLRDFPLLSWLVLVPALGWQSNGDKASVMVGAWAPSLSWLLPVSTTGSPAAVVTLPELVEQLKPMLLDLAIVWRSLEQLAANQNQFAAKQEQIAQNVATLREAEQEIRQAVYTPPRKLQSPTGQPSR
jgi:hypothetical protein